MIGRRMTVERDSSGDLHNRISRYVRLAFTHARLGEADKALEYWESAKAIGYDGSKSQKQFDLLIRGASTPVASSAPPLRRIRKPAE